MTDYFELIMICRHCDGTEFFNANGCDLVYVCTVCGMPNTSLNLKMSRRSCDSNIFEVLDYKSSHDYDVRLSTCIAEMVTRSEALEMAEQCKNTYRKIKIQSFSRDNVIIMDGTKAGP